MLNNFKEYYRLLKEGGNAVTNAARINQENVPATLEKIFSSIIKDLKLKKDDYGLLGSTGKRLPGGSSGDIDIAISIPSILKNNPKLNTLEDTLDFIEKTANKHSSDVHNAGGLGVISLGWPIENVDGKQEGQIVQLDLMLTDNVEWSKWAFHSPAEWESNWKGLYRNLVLVAVAKHMDYKTLKTAMNKEGEEVDVEYERNFYDMNKGLLRGSQSKIGKSGNIVKTVRTFNKYLLTMNPDEVVEMLFGPKFSAKTMLTFDDALNAVLDKDFIYKDKRDTILKMTAYAIKNTHYPVPEVLEQWITS